MLADAQQSCYVHQQMNEYRTSSNAQACGAQVASTVANKVALEGSVKSQQVQYQQIKLALDVHATTIVVPQPLLQTTSWPGRRPDTKMSGPFEVDTSVRKVKIAPPVNTQMTPGAK